MSDAKTPDPKDLATSAATDRAAAKVPASVDRAGDNTPTKPGAEAKDASSGVVEHSKHPPGERAEGAAVAVASTNETRGDAPVSPKKV